MPQNVDANITPLETLSYSNGKCFKAYSTVRCTSMILIHVRFYVPSSIRGTEHYLEYLTCKEHFESLMGKIVLHRADFDSDVKLIFHRPFVHGK